MRKYLYLIILLILNLPGNSQNLVGYKSSEIKVYMKRNCKGINLENVVNNRFKYLKYSDNSGSQTLLFFLNSDSVCKSIRIVCDQTARDERIRDLNSSCIKMGVNKWIDTLGRKLCRIELKDDKWSSNIIIEPEK